MIELVGATAKARTVGIFAAGIAATGAEKREKMLPLAAEFCRSRFGSANCSAVFGFSLAVRGPGVVSAMLADAVDRAAGLRRAAGVVRVMGG